MIFEVKEAYGGEYKKLTGEQLPTAVKFMSLGELMRWIEKSGNSVVINTAAIDSPINGTITVYNGNME